MSLSPAMPCSFAWTRQKVGSIRFSILENKFEGKELKMYTEVPWNESKLHKMKS